MSVRQPSVGFLTIFPTPQGGISIQYQEVNTMNEEILYLWRKKLNSLK